MYIPIVNRGFAKPSHEVLDSGVTFVARFPAFANKHVITRNDEEIISMSLAADDYK